MIECIDYVEFYVGNALQTAMYYQYFWGFELIAYSGHETGNKESSSYVLRQCDIIIVVTASYTSSNAIAKHVAIHGDSVKNIAFKVNSAVEAYNSSIKAGAKSEKMVAETNDDYGLLVESSVVVYGDTIHSFIERDKYNGVFKPGFIQRKGSIVSKSVGLTSIDHITANVESGVMGKLVKFYRNAFGLNTLIYFDENDIFTDYSAMSSTVLINSNEKIKLPLTEPINRGKKSQIQEFIDYNCGSGIQHLAFNTINILNCASDLAQRGVEFLEIPSEYYEGISERIPNYKEEIPLYKKAQVMIDQEKNGFLYQSFTKPILDRPTYFIELIQRNGSSSFGKGNVKALFNALVNEQNKRKNL